MHRNPLKLNTENMIKFISFLIVCALLPTWYALGIGVQTVKAQNSGQSYSTAVVFGASVIGNSYPSPVLKLRLDRAIELYQDGSVTSIIVSGDRRASNYNEPEVMKNYLITSSINPLAITEDFAGTRTLDTCFRLKNTFKLQEVVLVTQDFHMPRANLLCRSIGLRTQIATAPSSSNVVTVSGTLREYPALLYNLVLVRNNYTPDA
jgi:vancomycin permeability regulator SanA